MKFARADYDSDVAGLRADVRAEYRAMGDNFIFEENVGPSRLAHFENFAPTESRLKVALGGYFFGSVQGATRTHVPSTFESLNHAALLSSVEGNQKIIRVERLNDALVGTGIEYSALERAVATKPYDRTIIDPILRYLNDLPGARPMFCCFRREVAAEVANADWFALLRARLGLGHYSLMDGQIGHFALFEYTAAEVLRASTLPASFAQPTVFESRANEFFFPAPEHSGEGYAVDLDYAAGRTSIREFLHTRIDYSPMHLIKVSLSRGPSPAMALEAARDGHLAGVRSRTGRHDFGEMMIGRVGP